MNLRLPPTLQSIVGASGRVDPNWERWFGDLVRAVNVGGTSDPVQPPEPVSFVITGAGSLTADGSVEGGEFVVSLVGDLDHPFPGSVYGASLAGEKEWIPVYDLLSTGTGIAITDSGYTIIDTVSTPDDLPLTGNDGEAVRVTDAEPGIYAWDGSAFTLDTDATNQVAIALAELADAGTGTALKKILRDEYGRVAATEDANLGDLADVDPSGVADGDALVFDADTNTWKPGAGGAVQSIVAGSHISVDDTDPKNPVINVTGISTAGYDEGTSNPVSPSLNDKFYRTDLNLLIYYDGTQWLTVNEYALPGIQEATLGVSVNGVITRYPMQSARQIFITRWVVTTRVASGNDGSNYWTGALESQTAAASTSTIASVSTVSDASGDWVQHETVVDAVISSTEVVLRTNATKTGSPGAFYLADAIYFRQVVE